MSIDRFYTTTITNKRMTWSNDSSADVSVGSFSAHIQQTTPEEVQLLGLAWGNVFTIWCGKSEDVEIGDSITIASGDYTGVYSVKSIQSNATGNNQHLEIIVIKED